MWLNNRLGDMEYTIGICPDVSAMREVVTHSHTTVRFVQDVHFVSLNAAGTIVCACVVAFLLKSIGNTLPASWKRIMEIEYTVKTFVLLSSQSFVTFVRKFTATSFALDLFDGDFFAPFSNPSGCHLFLSTHSSFSIFWNLFLVQISLSVSFRDPWHIFFSPQKLTQVSMTFFMPIEIAADLKLSQKRFQVRCVESHY